MIATESSDDSSSLEATFFAYGFLAIAAFALGFSSSDESSDESSLETACFFATTVFCFSSFFGYFSVVAFFPLLVSEVVLPLF